jgi:hypothetical protein
MEKVEGFRQLSAEIRRVGEKLSAEIRRVEETLSTDFVRSNPMSTCGLGPLMSDLQRWRMEWSP